MGINAGGFNYNFNSKTPQFININGQKVKVEVTGGGNKTDVNLFVNDKGQIVVDNDSSKEITLKFDTNMNLDILVDESAYNMNIQTGTGNDNVQVSSNAKVKNIDTGKGNDSVNILANASVNNINTGYGDDIVNISANANVKDISTGDGKDEITNSGKANSINAGSPVCIMNCLLNPRLISSF